MYTLEIQNLTARREDTYIIARYWPYANIIGNYPQWGQDFESDVRNDTRSIVAIWKIKWKN